MKYVLLVLMLGITSCSTFSSAHFIAEGAKASALCIKGGYAMAGGTVTAAKINEGFKGSVIVRPDCTIAVEAAQ